MEAVPLLLSLGALVIVSMDLALSIIWNRRARYSWSRACIVFTASVMGAIVVYVLALYSAYAFSGTPGIVLRYIWEALLAADCAFIIAMLPFFACWIVARPMHTAEKIVTITSDAYIWEYPQHISYLSCRSSHCCSIFSG